MSSPDAEDLSPSPEHSGDEDDTDMLDEKGLHGEGDSSPPHSGSGRKSSSNAKDASRPRRKKARRACLACQRAHLTCGDERPCKRCIKRGLQDACQDGVRKKAKYLHDAPPEALMPGVGGHYREANGSQQSLQGQDSVPNSAVSMVQQAGFYPQGQTGSFGLYQQNPSDSQMSVQMQDASPISSFSNQQTPISPPYAQSGGNQTTTPGSASLPSASQAAAPQMQGFRGPLFDPSDPALYNFDIASLNFGSHYGALEFGMLGHISGAAADTPPNDGGLLTPLAQPPNMFQQTGGVSPQLPDSSTLIPTTMPFVADSMSDWPNPPVRQNSLQQMQTQKTMDNSLRHDGFSGPYAFTIGAGPSSLSSASPASTGQDMSAGYDQNSVSQQFFVNPNQQQTQQNSLFAQPQQAQAASGFALQPVNPNVGPRKRRRDTRAIYEELKQPYPYTQAFHRLQKLLQQRLPSNKVVRVAKAMASIRPTFIACMKDLDEQDLIHQEQTFQRKLWSYQDWLEYMGTPTLIIRRSGEVAAVGKEFCILSGWRKDVLLGKDPNLNVNWDCSPGQNSGASSRNASSTPRIPTQEDNSRPQPVFLAELLDSDSVVQFYEDFARLAFGDARGAVERRCRVMKYQAKLDDDTATNTTDSISQRDEGSRKKQKPRNLTRLDNPDGAGASAEKTQSWRPEKDSVECMMGWMCWHDQFDMPAMIVMNFLPILQPTQPDSERSRMSTAGLPPR